jgi:hypothetical protein
MGFGVYLLKKYQFKEKNILNQPFQKKIGSEDNHD